MYVKTSNGAFNRAESVIGTIIEKITGINRSRKKFIKHILVLYMGMRGRYNFLNMARYGRYSEQSYRNNFSQHFDFFQFNIELSKQSCSAHRIIAFDPSYIPKSGKHTDHLGWFWSGTSGKALKGLEIAGLAVVDVDNNTALSLEAIQTPSVKELKEQGKTLADHYANVIIERAEGLRTLSDYLVGDGYFAKHNFIETITGRAGLHVISKFRNDANIMYLHHGEKKRQRGRPKKYDGKADMTNIDKRRIRFEYEDEQSKVYSGIAWSVGLQREIKIAYVEYWKHGIYTGQYAVLFSTDLNLEGKYIYLYYKSRFQIEFLYRDAKQYCGLTDCQGRSENKLHFHFNASLTTVSLAKAVHYLPENNTHLKVKKSPKEPFSMSSIKTINANKIIAERIFSNLDLNLNCKKIRRIYRDALFWGSIYAKAA